MPAAPILMPYVLTLGIGWAYYRRIRRHIGRQAWQPRRTLARLFLLVAATCGLLAVAIFLPGTWISLGIGAGFVAGIAAGFIGIASTRTGHDERGRWYVPNPWIGGALAVLLVGRLAWRMLHAGQFVAGMGRMQASPLTLGIAAALVGYYLSYSILLMARMRRSATAA